MEVYSWENHLFLWAHFSMAMLNNQRVTYSARLARSILQLSDDQLDQNKTPASTKPPKVDLIPISCNMSPAICHWTVTSLERVDFSGFKNITHGFQLTKLQWNGRLWGWWPHVTTLNLHRPHSPRPSEMTHTDTEVMIPISNSRCERYPLLN